LLLALLLLGDAAGAAAQGSNDLSAQRKADARALYERGLQHYNLAEYDQAIAAFKRSYELSNAPELLFNIAQALRFKGDCPQAVLVYRSYMREAQDRANRAKAESGIERCARQQQPSPLPPEQPRQQEPATAATAAAATPSSPALSPASTPSSLPPGSPSVSPALVARADRAPPLWPPRRLESWLGLGAAGLGVGLLTAAVFLGLEARSAEKEVDAAFADGRTWTEQLVERERSGRSAARAANLLIGGGAALLVGGGVLYYLGLRRAPAGAEVAIVLPPGGVVTAFGGRF
jgi:tetratricopeptide (TPR) repeat protein